MDSLLPVGSNPRMKQVSRVLTDSLQRCSTDIKRLSEQPMALEASTIGQRTTGSAPMLKRSRKLCFSGSRGIAFASAITDATREAGTEQGLPRDIILHEGDHPYILHSASGAFEGKSDESWRKPRSPELLLTAYAVM